MTADALFNAYLDANIVLFLAACIWAIARFVLSRSALRLAFSAQLQLIYGALLTIAFAPLIIIAFHFARQQGWLGDSYIVNFSDLAVAQFLDGNIALAPSRFATLLSMRDVLTENVTSLASVWGQLIAAGLLGGAVFFTGKAIRSGWQVAGIVRTSYVWRKIGRVEIRLTDQTHMPFSTRGLRKHYIIIPSELLSEANDLRIAVAHELQHMRQKDLFWEVVLEVLRPVFFWNPAYVYWKREVENLRELACDQHVIVRRSVDVRAYCECLLRICHNSLRKDGARQMMVPGVAFAQVDRSRSGGKSARFLKYRVLSMLEGAGLQPGRLLTLCLMAGLAGMIAFGTIASQRTSDWSQDRLMLSAIVNLERLETLNNPNP